MDEQTFQQLLSLLQQMEINRQKVINVRDNRFCSTSGMKTFRVVTTDEHGGNPELYYISFPETFRFPPQGTTETTPAQAEMVMTAIKEVQGRLREVTPDDVDLAIPAATMSTWQVFMTLKRLQESGKIQISQDEVITCHEQQEERL